LRSRQPSARRHHCRRSCERPRGNCPHKTGRSVQFEITEQTRASLQDWLTARPADRGPYLFPSRVHNQPHVTARQYARIVRGWIGSAGMDSKAYGTHSLRRTKGAQIYHKDRQSARGPVASRAYEDREHRPLPRDRSR
jgi:hypothetical protein